MDEIRNAIYQATGVFADGAAVADEIREARSMEKSEIKAARERAGYSVRAFSELAGCAPSTLQDIESGKKIPRADTLRKIADALGCTMDSLWPSIM